MEFPLNFLFAWSGPLSRADFRSCNSDFVVREELGFEPEGEGEHLYLHIQKSGENTQWIAKHLAKFCGVKVMDVGYCGMKDRHALTSQWFSVYSPKAQQFDWHKFEQCFTEGNVQVRQHSRGEKKLRRGQHRSNKFEITLRNIECDSQKLDDRLASIKTVGVPNYFGEQRFGRDGGNLTQADQYFNADQDPAVRKRRRKPAPIVISAARSYLFNLVLNERVENQTWHKDVSGEILDDDHLPTGPLWGRGRNLSSDSVADIETKALAHLAMWKTGLEHCGLNQERRSLVLKPYQLEWSRQDSHLCLNFALAPGAFATSVLRELFQLNNIAQKNSVPSNSTQSNSTHNKDTTA